MKKLFQLMGFLCLYTLAYSQTTLQPNQISASSIEHYREIQNGAYQVGWRTLKSNGKDTSDTKTATVYFYRDGLTQLDSIAQFIWKISDREWRVYDGDNLYMIDHKKKKIELYPLAQKGGIFGYIYQPLDQAPVNNLFIPCLQNVPLPLELRMPLTMSAKSQLTETQFNNQPYWHISSADTFDIPAMLGNGQTFGVMGKKLLIDHDYNVYSSTYYTDLGPGNRHWDEAIMKPYPLPSDSATFDQSFNLEALLAQGYKMKEQPVKKERKQIEAGAVLPDLTVWKASGKTMQLTKLAPDGILLLDFWFANCPPCVLTLPSISAIYDKYQPKGVTVLSINPIDQNLEAAEKFMRSKGASHPTVFMDRLDAQRIGVLTYPKFVIVDAKTRKILEVFRGRNLNTLEADLSARLDFYLEN